VPPVLNLDKNYFQLLVHIVGLLLLASQQFLSLPLAVAVVALEVVVLLAVEAEVVLDGRIIFQ
tara:strand:- start:327 stop:515 length:189 start_codon:yes stop_codon:yes gene_type:complete